MRSLGGEPRPAAEPFRRTKKPWARLFGAAEVLEQWQTNGTWRNVTWSHRVEPQEARFADMPAEIAPSVQRALQERGIARLYSHQARAFELASQIGGRAGPP